MRALNYGLHALDIFVPYGSLSFHSFRERETPIPFLSQRLFFFVPLWLIIFLTEKKKMLESS